MSQYFMGYLGEADFEVEATVPVTYNIKHLLELPELLYNQ